MCVCVVDGDAECGRTLQESSGSFGYPWPPPLPDPLSTTGFVDDLASSTSKGSSLVGGDTLGGGGDGGGGGSGGWPAACQWRISGTHGEKIVVNITSMMFATADCSTDYLEVRDGHWYKSPLVGKSDGRMSMSWFRFAFCFSSSHL